MKQFESLPSIAYFSISIEFNDNWLPIIGIEFHFGKEYKFIKEYVARLEYLGYYSSLRSKALLDILEPKKVKSDGISYKRNLSHFKININKKGVVEPKVYVQITPNYASVFGL